VPLRQAFLQGLHECHHSQNLVLRQPVSEGLHRAAAAPVDYFEQANVRRYTWMDYLCVGQIRTNPAGSIRQMTRRAPLIV
jgi:hypothetical protein